MVKVHGLDMVQGTLVRSLVQGDPMCATTTETELWSLRATITEAHALRAAVPQ